MKNVNSYLLLFFALTLLAGLFLGWQFIAQDVSIVEDAGDVSASLFVFGYILAATGLLFLVLKYYKGRNLFKALEFLLVFSSVQIVLFLFVNELLSLAGGLIAVGVRLWQPRVKNGFLLFAAMVVGAVLGSSLDLLPALVLAWLLASYDYVAVFKTKHMVKLAKQLSSRGAAFAIHLKKKKESVQLGTGDVVVPVMLSVSALKLSVPAALLGVAGAVVGLGLLLGVLEKFKGYYPALPPIVAYTTAFIAASFLL
ncbi:MAG: presenilin family intramembrane aspartyl protease [Candidatus Micrarchaeota archaeon]